MLNVLASFVSALFQVLEQKQLCLAEAERKYNKVIECSTELQVENRYLLSVVDALRRSKSLQKRHSETCMKFGQETVSEIIVAL